MDRSSGKEKSWVFFPGFSVGFLEVLNLGSSQGFCLAGSNSCRYPITGQFFFAPLMVGLVREMGPRKFQGKLLWWNIAIWPESYLHMNMLAISVRYFGANSSPKVVKVIQTHEYLCLNFDLTHLTRPSWMNMEVLNTFTKPTLCPQLGMVTLPETCTKSPWKKVRNLKGKSSSNFQPSIFSGIRVFFFRAKNHFLFGAVTPRFWSAHLRVLAKKIRAGP